MKKLIALAIVAFFATVGCSGFQVTDSANHQAISYASGKTTGALVNKFVPQADKPLGEAWGNMMVDNNGADPIAVEKIMAFYADAVMLIGANSKDPYGILSDLTMMLSIYGGSIEYDETGGMKLVLVQPIPLQIAKVFELGYKSGRSAVQGFSVQRQVP